MAADPKPDEKGSAVKNILSGRSSVKDEVSKLRARGRKEKKPKRKRALLKVTAKDVKSWKAKFIKAGEKALGIKKRDK
jgi:hypothetical protein